MDRAAPREEPGAGPGSGTQPTNATNASPAVERERVRVEFYATYDVMTGVRIAATLGGFFALMVFLVVYKSRSKSVKALRDPKIVELAEAAVAEEEAVEEERQLTAALESALAERARSRASLGELPPWPRAPRFASVGGGYGSLLAPPRRLAALRGDSLPASALRFDARDRRLSSATCSSSGGSYLERRPLRGTRQPPRPAPLASVGSLGASFVVECELGSIASAVDSAGADSVFAEGADASTDDEVEQFSTDSGGCEAGGRRDCTEMASRPKPPLDPECVSRERETLF